MLDENMVDLDADREGRILARIHGFIESCKSEEPHGRLKIVVVRTGRKPETMCLASFNNMVDGYAAYERFDHLYRVNASVILGNILRSVVPQDLGYPGIYFRTNWFGGSQRGTPHEILKRGDIKALADALSLQVLYRFKRMGAVADATTGCDEVRIDEVGKSLTGSELNWRGDPMWSGTGRYEPRAIDRERLLGAVETLAFFGLIAQVDRRLEITKRGERLLDLLHPDNEDQDLLLRWRGPADEAMRFSMDDWILRNFRKMKHRFRKANPLQSEELESGMGETV
jgi:hypothetical protein